MPDWLNPSVVNTMFLAVFFCVVIWGIIRSAFFFAPLITKRFEAQSQKHEADARLAESLQVTSSRQIELQERTTTLLNDQGLQLTQHGHILDAHGQQLQIIAKCVGADIVLPLRGSVTLVPSVPPKTQVSGPELLAQAKRMEAGQ